MRPGDIDWELAKASDRNADYRPMVAEVGLNLMVRDVLSNGDGTPAERAQVAVGIIRNRVERAYHLEAAQ